MRVSYNGLLPLPSKQAMPVRFWSPAPCLRGPMDTTSVYGTEDAGSIPAGGTMNDKWAVLLSVLPALILVAVLIGVTIYFS
jgi:hypothetical protein